MNKFLGLTFIPALLLCVVGNAHSSTCRWIGPDNGVWNNAANWSTKTVPGTSDSVIIDSKKKVSIPTNASVTNLTVGAGAEIKNGSKIKVTGKIDSAGIFTGKGVLDIPTGAVATFGVNRSNLLGTTSGSTFVFAPIINKGTVIARVAQGLHVDFASVQNAGTTQIISDGQTKLEDIRNTGQLSVKASGKLSFGKIDNAAGSSFSVEATRSFTAPFINGINGKTTKSDAGTLIEFDDLINHEGGRVSLSGTVGSASFEGISLSNAGEMRISGALVALESNATNDEGGTLVLDSGATLSSADSSANTLDNAGELIKAAGSDATLQMDLTNTGHLIVEDGTLHVQTPDREYTQTAGTTSVEGGTLSVEGTTGNSRGTFEVTGGIVNGIGTITGNVINSGGHFKPGHSPGTITINGSYTQTADGVLDMEVGGTAAGTGYDQMVVNGTAYLAGTLNMTRWNGFTPSNGDIYTLLTYYSKSGNFSNFADATPVAGITYDTTLTPTDLELNCYAAPADTTAPTVSISAPTNGGAVRSLTTATGKASDAGGISKVTCRLYRYANSVTGVAAGYWAGGTTWTTSASAGNDRPASGTTSWTFTLPTMASGRYSLLATATDAASNSASTSTISFYVDPNAPTTLTVSSPANNATISSLSQISGTVSEAADGSGIATVQYQLKRASDSTYWNGTAWTATAYSFSSALSGTNWARSTNLPTGSSLLAGKYSVIAIATDKAGNTKSLTTVFSVASSTTTSTKTG